MTEDPIIIQANIARCAMLKLAFDDKKSLPIRRLLAEAEENQASAAGLAKRR